MVPDNIHEAAVRNMRQLCHVLILELERRGHLVPLLNEQAMHNAIWEALPEALRQCAGRPKEDNNENS